MYILKCSPGSKKKSHKKVSAENTLLAATTSRKYAASIACMLPVCHETRGMVFLEWPVYIYTSRGYFYPSLF